MATRDGGADAARAAEITAMIDARRLQRTFGDGFVEEALGDVPDAWMPQADALLDDDLLLAAVYDALG